MSVVASWRRLLASWIVVSLFALPFAGLVSPPVAQAEEPPPSEAVWVAPDYVFETEFGSLGAGSGQLSGPQALAVSADGEVYVCDTGNRRVEVFDSEGAYVRSWAWAPPGESAEAPIDIALCGTDVVVLFRANPLMSSTSYLVAFDAAGVFKSRTSATGMGGIDAYDADTVAGNATNGIVYLMNLDGTRDTSGMLDSDGNDLSSYGYGGDSFADCAVGSEGGVYVGTAPQPTHATFLKFIKVANKLQIVSESEGQGFPADIGMLGRMASGPTGLFMAAPGFNSIVRYSSAPQFIETIGLGQGSGPGQLDAAGGVDVDSDGNLWVADTGNNRVQKFKYYPLGSPERPYDYSGGTGDPDVGDNGTVVVLMTGWTSDSYNARTDWGTLWPLLMAGAPNYFWLRVAPISPYSDNPLEMDSYGLLSTNEERLNGWLASQPELAGKDVVFVTHSMGGLIARGFVSTYHGRYPLGIRPKAIIQLDSPNMGSVAAPFAWEKSGHRDYAAWNMYPQRMASWNATRLNADTDVRIWQTAGVLYPHNVTHGDFLVPYLDTPESKYTDKFLKVNLALYLGESNDGPVAVHSAFGPPGLQGCQPEDQVPLNVKHTSGLYFPPFKACSIQPLRSQRLDRVAEVDRLVFGWFLDALSYQVPTTVAGAGTIDPAQAEAEVEAPSASMLTTAASGFVRELVPISVPVSLEGTAALVHVGASDTALTVTLKDASGTPQAVYEIDPGKEYVVECASSGDHVLTVSSGSSVLTPVTVLVEDAGSTPLIVDGDADASAGGAFVLHASLESSSGPALDVEGSMSVDGQVYELKDDGLGSDASAGDGVFTGAGTAPLAAGRYDVRVEMTGESPEGATVERVSSTPLAVSPEGMELSDPTVRIDRDDNGLIENVFLDVSVSSSVDATCLVTADLSTPETGLLVQPRETLRVTGGTPTTASIEIRPEAFRGCSSTGTVGVLDAIRLSWIDEDGNETVADESDATLEFPVPDQMGFVDSYVTAELVGPNPSATPTLTVQGRAVSTTATIGSVEFSVDEGATWHPTVPSDSAFDSNVESYTVSMSLPEGTARLFVRAVDGEGHALVPEAEQARLSLTVDMSPPSTTMAAATDGDGTTTISLVASETASAVKNLYCSIDGGPVVEASEISTSLPEGIYTAEYWADDAAGNVEQHHTASFTVDVTPPTTTSNAVSSYIRRAAITLTATDTVSGVASTRWTLDGTLGTGMTASTTALGSHTLRFASTDVAGNVEATKTVSFVVNPAPITRASGTDRYATSVEISKKHFTSADTVVIACGTSFPDALAASSLAGVVDGPVLLTTTASLPTVVRTEVLRLGADKAYIIGSTTVVSDAVKTALESAGLTTERKSGSDRYATAAQVAYEVRDVMGSSFPHKAFVVVGTDFPDGLSASPYGASQGFPVLLTTTDSLPSATSSALSGLGTTYSCIVGSTSVVSSGVENSIKAIVPTVERVYGSDRYYTSAALATKALLKGWATRDYLGVATGADFPDALSGGPAAGSRDGVVLLTNSTTLSPSVTSYVNTNLYNIYGVWIYGSTTAVSQGVQDSLTTLLDN